VAVGRYLGHKGGNFKNSICALIGKDAIRFSLIFLSLSFFFSLSVCLSVTLLLPPCEDTEYNEKVVIGKP
jgi:hypothetical protein